MQRRFIFPSLIVFLAILSFTALKLYKTKEIAPTPNIILIKEKFSLLDQNSQPINENFFLENYSLIFFGFTYCPDVCPTVLQAMSIGLDLVDEISIKIRPIFITIDPNRDKPEVLKSYLENFHPLITGLTGNPEEIKKVAKAFGIYYAKAKENRNSKEDYLMDHSGGIFLIGPNGEFITKISHSATPDEIVREIKNNT